MDAELVAIELSQLWEERRAYTMRISEAHCTTGICPHKTCPKCLRVCRRNGDEWLVSNLGEAERAARVEAFRSDDGFLWAVLQA